MTSAGTPNVDLAELRQQARALTDFAVNPQVIELLEEIEASPDPIAAADELATVDELRRRGIDISDDLRLTLRYFESADDVEGHERVIWAPVAEAQIEASGSWTVCGSIGAPIVPICLSVGRTPNPQ